MVSIRVLGALDATVAGRGTELGGPRQRAVLARLLVARGEVVSVDRLIDDLWSGAPPPSALGALQAYISNLRRALEPQRPPRTPASVLVSSPPGYTLRIAIEDVDAWSFEARARDAAEIRDPAARRIGLESALAAWRGPAFAEFGAQPWALPEVRRLDELRAAARERLAAATREAGDAATAAAEAELLTTEFPLREEGWRQLALARYAGGRQADALAALRAARRVLADELGIDPGPALIATEADILGQRIEIRPQAPPAGDAFVGRHAELTQLVDAAIATPSDPWPGDAKDFRVALVAGEAGSGKTTLLQHFRRDLEGRGWRVVVGRCPETDGAPPAWAWVEVLRKLAAEVDPGALRDRLSTLLRDDAGETAADATFARFRLHHAVAAYLDAAAADRKLAVFIDDVHRGDTETLSLVASIAENSDVFTLVSYRPDEVSGPLEHMLATVAKSTRARIRLNGLAATDAERLIRAVSGVVPDRRTVALLTERTGGNPFYLRESARLLGSEGELVAISEVPEGVRDVLRRRFARLPEDTVAVLRLLAVVGREADVDVVVHAADTDEETVLGALDAGILAGLLDEPGPGRIRFAHTLVRDTLYADVSGIRRGRLHRRVAGALVDHRPGDVAALAHHFGEGLAAGTARRAADYAIAAARQAEQRFGHDVAAHYFQRALAALELLADDTVPDRVHTLAALSKCHLADGNSPAARESRAAAATCAAAAGRLDLLVTALTAWNIPTPWLNRRYGSLDSELVSLLDAALRWDGLTSVQRCRLLVALVGEISGEQDQRAHAAITEAVAIARHSGDRPLLAMALYTWVELHDYRMSRTERDTLGRELVDLGSGDDLAIFAMIGHYVLSQNAFAFGELALATEHLDTSSALADRYQLRQAQGTALMSRALLAVLRGDFTTAERRYTEVHELFVRQRSVDADAVFATALITLRIAQGRVGELVSVLRNLDVAADGTTADPLALALLAANDRAGAAAAHRESGRIRNDFFRSMFLTIRALVVARLGLADEADDVYRQLLHYRGQIGGGGTGSFAVGSVDSALGELAVLMGDHASARVHFAAARELAVRCGCPPWIADASDRLERLS